MREIDFRFPQAAFLMVLVAFLFFMQLYLYQYRQTQIQSYADSGLLSYLLRPRSKIKTMIKIGLSATVWILLCLALMSPEGNVHYLPAFQSRETTVDQTHEVIFLVDTSASMNVQDGESGKTRLDEVKGIIQSLIGQLKNTSIAVYAFTSVLTPVVPQTLDHVFTRLAVRELSINEGDVGGTQFKPVMEELKNVLSKNSFASAFTVILFSDGGDNQVYQTNHPSQKEISDILNIIPHPEDLHLIIFTVGTGRLTPSVIPNVTTLQGKPVMSKLQPELLNKLAEHSGGQYFEASQANNREISRQLLAAVEHSAKKRIETRQSKVVPILEEDKISDLYFQIPLGIAIVLLLGGLIVPDV